MNSDGYSKSASKSSFPPESNSHWLIPTIPVEFIHQMVAHIRLSSLPETVTDYHAQLLRLPRVSIAQYHKLFGLLTESLDDEMLGFLSRPVPQGSYSFLCEALQSCSDLTQALLLYNQFYSLFIEGDCQLLDLSGLNDKGRISLCLVGKHHHQPMFQQTIILSLLKTLTWLAGQRIASRHLTFSFAKMPFDAEFNYLYGTVPEYGGDSAHLFLPVAALSCGVKPKLKASEIGQHYIEHLLYWWASDELPRRVYAEIACRLKSDDFDIVSIAEVLHVSKHTLTRKLKEYDTSYSAILMRVRKDKAIYLLLNGSDSLEAIAIQLGFAEFGSFSRAFKQWTGISPSEYRDKR